MTSSQDNRRSFRISEAVYLKYETLTDVEFEEGLERRKVRLGLDNGAQSVLIDIDARLSQAMFMLHSDFEQIGKLVSLLNDKVNVAINHLPGLKEAKAGLAGNDPQVCDVGADGMVFSSEEPIAPGTKLYLEFLIESDNRYVETFCTVVRTTDSPNIGGQSLPFGNAVEFNGMKSGQREILIQHMFNRESETLRMRRLSSEAED
jgi:hypothetical protein